MTGGRKGRPAVANEVKRARGNPGKRPIPKEITVIPLAPAEIIEPGELTEQPSSGAQVVAELLRSGASAWISSTEQHGLLKLLAEAWDRREELREAIRVGGYIYETTVQGGGVRYYKRPEVEALERVEAQITTWMIELGLTTLSRSRLGVAEVKARSKLEQLRAKREMRLAATSQ